MKFGALLVLSALVGSGICGWAQEPHPAVPFDPTQSGKLYTAETPIAPRVVLYEEDPNDPSGKRTVGSVTWRTDMVPADAGNPPELGVQADIEIPERKMSMTWTLRRNPKSTGPTSHAIEILFNLPPDFPNGGIFNVPGIWLKESEQTQGTPLAGRVVKVTTRYFLIGLSNAPAERERNLQLLKDRPWFDVPIVYTNNRRAILAMEKGTPGQRAFAGAFAAWGVAPRPAMPANPPAVANLEPSTSQRSSSVPTPATLIPLRRDGGVFTVPVTVNGKMILDFVLDSGAADVAIPADVVLTLMRTGTLGAADFLGKQTYTQADGSSLPSQTFRIKSLQIGNKIIENVTGNVAPVKGDLLLGQSFLSRFKSWSIDNQRQVLVLE